MAHRPVGAGISLTTSASSGMTTSFIPQSNVMRVVAVTSGAFVAIGTNPTATIADYYIPAGTSETLAMTKASNRVVGITTGTTTIIDCPEGTQAPFGVGDYVTITGSTYHNFVHVPVISVNTTSGVEGYFQKRFIVDYNSSGIATAFSSPDASVSISYRLAARTEGSSGIVYAQQVQLSGQA
tara:strand:- start:11090 stop:11635 length:546 start_codon:yes stop_codon:yes gene_type:complete